MADPRRSQTLLYDGHGDLRTVTNASQTVTATGNYEAYGQAAGGTGSSSTPYQYGATSGYRSDGDAGLLHIGARWYDPVIGRWISADPFLGKLTDPLSRNRYLYCQANPIGGVDPTGHSLLWGGIDEGIAGYGTSSGPIGVLLATPWWLVVAWVVALAFVWYVEHRAQQAAEELELEARQAGIQREEWANFRERGWSF